MITQIMDFCNNHFSRSYERKAYAIVANGVTGDFDETYVIGQYLWIRESFVNDGVYKIIGVSTTKLTLDANLTEESTGEQITVLGCAVPKPFLSIVSDIESWVTEYAGKEGLASESIDDYSVAFGSNKAGQTNSWQSAFAGRLQPYRQVYETPIMPRKGGYNGYL